MILITWIKVIEILLILQLYFLDYKQHSTNNTGICTLLAVFIHNSKNYGTYYADECTYEKFSI